MYYSVSSEMSVALISEDVRQLGEQVKSVIDSMNGKQGGGRTRPDGPPAGRLGAGSGGLFLLFTIFSSSVKSDVEFNSMLEMRRQRQFPLFQEGGQMIADKAKLSGNEFALFTRGDPNQFAKSQFRFGIRLIF